MDKGLLEKILDQILGRILEVVTPKKVILFGSAARGEMGKHSDIDLLVVVASGLHRRRTAQRIYRNLIGVGFAADIVVVTEEDLDRYKDCQGMVIMTAIEEGKVLYAAA